MNVSFATQVELRQEPGHGYVYYGRTLHNTGTQEKRDVTMKLAVKHETHPTFDTELPQQCVQIVELLLLKRLEQQQKRQQQCRGAQDVKTLSETN